MNPDELPASAPAQPTPSGPTLPPPAPGEVTFAPPSAPPFAPPTGPPAQWTEVNLGTTGEPASSSRAGRRRLVAVGAVVALGVGGLASVRLLRSSSAASSTAQGAVEQFIHALEKRDLLGAVDTFPKADRELIVGGLDAVSKQSSEPLKNIDLHALPGYTLSITGLKTTTEEVNDHIAVVTLAGGHYKVTANLGDALNRAKLDSLATGTQADALAPSGEGDLDKVGTPLQIATVHDGEGWHVSLPYTIAELARRSQHLPPPDPAARIAAKGASSAQDATRAFVDAVASADWRRVIELLPDDEAAVLHDYGSLFGTKAFTDAKPWAKVTAFETHTKAEGKRTGVIVDKLVFDVLPAANSDDKSVSIARDGAGCFRVATVSTDEPHDTRGCVDDIVKSIRDNDKLTGALPSDFESQLRSYFDRTGFVTVEQGGQWFVSPVYTIASLGAAALLGGAGAFVRNLAGVTNAAAGSTGSVSGGGTTGSVPALTRTGGARAVALTASQAFTPGKSGRQAMINALKKLVPDVVVSETPDAPSDGPNAVSWLPSEEIEGGVTVAVRGADRVCYMLRQLGTNPRQFGRYDASTESCHASGTPIEWSDDPGRGWR